MNQSVSKPVLVCAVSVLLLVAGCSSNNTEDPSAENAPIADAPSTQTSSDANENNADNGSTGSDTDTDNNNQNTDSNTENTDTAENTENNTDNNSTDNTSNTDNTDNAGNADNAGNYADGSPSNAGIAGLPRAGLTPTTQARPALIHLDYLTDANGFSKRLSADDAYPSTNIRSLGDVNGDGSPDFTFSYDKRTQVVFGGKASLNEIDFDNLAGEAGFILDYATDLIGVGDVNGDGIDDIGRNTYDDTTNTTGARIIFGRSDGALKKAIQSPNIGVDGFDVSHSVRTADVRTITSAGDFNGDGVADLLIGSYGLNGDDHRAANAWVLFGGANVGADGYVDVASLSADRALTLVSPLSDEQFAAVYDSTGTGYNASVTGGFDLNGDGIDDIAVGTHRFDWLAQQGQSRSYVIYGSRTRTVAQIDMVTMEAQDGVRIESVARAFSPQPDHVVSVGDIDNNGFADLAIVNDDVSMVVFGASNINTAVMTYDEFAEDAVLMLNTATENTNILFMSAIGDVDNDGIDDLGVYFNSEKAAIVYGGTDIRSANGALDSTADLQVTNVDGLGGYIGYPVNSPMIALGDINNDGVDDVGIGWNHRYFTAGISEVADVNDDGMDDLQISKSDLSGSVYLMRVLYGYQPDGFTGFLPATPNIQPVAVVESGLFDAMIDAINVAGQSVFLELNDSIRNNVDLGPSIGSCLDAATKLTNGDVQAFSCDQNPVKYGYDWGSGKYSGSSEAHIASASVDNDVVQTMDYTTLPLPTIAPGNNPYRAYFTYDAAGDIVLSNGQTVQLGQEKPEAARTCTINVATRITKDDPNLCLSLVDGLPRSLLSVFKSDDVRNLRLLP